MDQSLKVPSFNQLHHYGEVSYYQLKTVQEIGFIIDKKIAFEINETATEIDYCRMMRHAKNVIVEKVIVHGKNSTNFDSYICAA